ncbi:pentapeptide repeat-containing protein [Thalassovita sp.]|uniref:pentapeptide repeat-containing protein n=1 Tax=Thalassovita sp. TaxID=1979401 RepID=UPI002AB111F2|nr:pentapeptide repeat-containing protein [Thalassovita sp.]
MRREHALELLKKGPEEWNKWAEAAKKDLDVAVVSNNTDWKRRAEKECRIDFSSHIFSEDADFSNLKFPGVTDFRGATFKGPAVFTMAKFCDDVLFDNATFEHFANFPHTSFLKSLICHSVTFQGPVRFLDARIDKAEICNSEFVSDVAVVRTRIGFGSRLHVCNFNKTATFDHSLFARGVELCHLTFEKKVSFKHALLGDVYFQELVAMDSSDFGGAELSGVRFTNADLRGADFRGCHFDETTNFASAKLTGAIMENFGLACMTDNGGITKGMRMQMDIKDDVAELRQSFGGFKTLLHLIFLTVFAFPYLWFVVSRYAEASFAEGQHVKSIALWDAFCRYVVNGGLSWQAGYQLHWTFLTFIAALLFNALRVVLLRKTMLLELSQTARRLPEIFSLSEEVEFLGKPLGFTWGQLVKTNDFLFWVQGAAVLFSTFHFLTMRVPV